MNTCVDTGECHCECHKPGRHAAHIMPCCTKCQYCGRRIRREMRLYHEKHCLSNPKNKREDD